MKVKEIKSCRRMRVNKNIRCRWTGSLDIVCWLAMVIRGSSQKERVRRGEEILSRFRRVLDLESSRERLRSARENM